MSYDAEVIAAMRAYGLDPGNAIKWTGKKVRFPGPGESRRKKDGAGWYFAFPDHPRNVRFGCFKTGVDTSWWPAKNGKKEDELDPAQWAEVQAHREAKDRERDEEAARVAEECRVRWENASEPSPGHPYLEKKGITTFPNLRQEGDGVLIVRMTSFADGNPVVSLQTINAQGEKRFVAGSRALGSRCTIGGAHLLHRRKNARKTDLYICEGYATGWSIYRATNSTVVVAFSTANLMAVAKALREKYGKDQSIVICADNDRWSMTHRGPNPGVTYAQDAAKEIDAFLCIPDFEDLASKPTDFNDLMLLEGLDAVKEWLDPGYSELARIVAEPGDGGPEPPPSIEEWTQEVPAAEETPAADPGISPEETPHWLEDGAFRCLGFDRDVYYYFPYETGQVKPITAAQHTPNTFITMADLGWWEEHFASKSGVNWKLAQSVLNRACHRKGVFNNNHVRGRGCWRVEDKEGNRGIVLHLGDRLLAPDAKTYVKPVRYECPEGRIYESLARLAGPSAKEAIDAETARKILGLFQDLLWLDGSSPYLLAGWAVLAPICGVLPWRPHVWITGNSGCGKTTVVKDLVKPLLGDMLLWVEGVSTEAGIRQSLKCDALPVLYDEAEKEDSRYESRIQSIIGLARTASSTDVGATITKGTRSGQAMHFHVRSMFCWSSINASLKRDSDRQRIAILQLKSKENLAPGEKDAHWSHYKVRLGMVRPELGRGLIARTLGWLRDGRLDATLDVFRDTASKVMGDPRYGDQYGTLYAGAWTLMADEVPTPQEAREIMGADSLAAQMEDRLPEGLRALQIIVQEVERVDTSEGVKQIAVGELLDISTGDLGKCSKLEADAKLKQIGIKTDFQDGERVALIANKSQWIEKVLGDSPYTNIQAVLRNLSGISSTPAVRFHSGFVSRCTVVPFRLFDE